MVKTLSYDENGMKKGAWSRDEDDKLRVYIQRYGHWNWRELPKFAGLKRCGKSCRLRWLNYLRPNVKRGNYTREEDELILKLIEEHGNKWSLISAKLSGRTDNEVKNHWHTKLKKLSKQSSTTKTTSEEKNQTSQSSESETSDQNIKEIESPPPAPETLLADNNDASSSPTILETSEPFMLSNEEVISFSSIYDCAFESSICGINDVPAAAEYNCVASSSSSSSSSSSPSSSSERLSEYDSDFWTQPFFSDTHYYENVCQSNSLVEEGGFMFPYSNSYGDDDDVVDLFYQVMQQYPEEY